MTYLYVNNYIAFMLSTSLIYDVYKRASNRD